MNDQPRAQPLADLRGMGSAVWGLGSRASHTPRAFSRSFPQPPAAQTFQSTCRVASAELFPRLQGQSRGAHTWSPFRGWSAVCLGLWRPLTWPTPPPNILAAFCPTLTLCPGCAHSSSPAGCGKPLCAHSMLSVLTMSKSLPPAESRVIGGMRPEQPRRTKAPLGPGRTKDFRRPLPGWCCSRRLFLVPHATAGGWPATPASHVRRLDLSFMLVPIRP